MLPRRILLRLGGNRVVNHVVEKGEKLFAGHFPTPVFLTAFVLWK